MKTQRIALPVWSDNICPVLDFARSIIIVDVADGKKHSRELLNCSSASWVRLTGNMVDLGVKIIICGALSTELLRLLKIKNIVVIPYIQGRVNEVLNAYWVGTLSLPKFRLPGTPPPEMDSYLTYVYSKK